MGRPPKNKTDLKSKIVAFRVSPTKYEQLKKNAENNDMAMTKYCLIAVEKKIKEDNEKNAG